MIKNIVFDIGNVIAKGKTYTMLSKLNLSNADYETIKQSFFNYCMDLDKGYITIEDRLNMSDMPVYLKDKYHDELVHYYRYRTLDDGVLNLIRTLKENGYGLYILSDNNRWVIEYLQSNPKLKYIDGWVASCDYATTKVEKKLYQILFDKYNLNPTECYFVDDKECNIAIGREYGMDGFIFAGDVDALKLDMQRHNINCTIVK